MQVRNIIKQQPQDSEFIALEVLRGSDIESEAPGHWLARLLRAQAARAPGSPAPHNPQPTIPNPGP
eukprot:2232700-Rhodomonas_salina.3